MNPTRESKHHKGTRYNSTKGWRPLPVIINQPISTSVTGTSQERHRLLHSTNCQYTIYIIYKRRADYKEREFRDINQLHAMQCSHSPTTWRHPKENDTMGSTYSCGNLAPWQVWGGGCVAIAEKGHLTLWLAVSGCQVGGGAKEGKKQWDFLFLKSKFKAPFFIFVPHSRLFCLTNQMRLLWVLP